MGFLKILRLLFVLFTTTCAFCWVFTSHWIFGPIVTIASFLGGILCISLLGIILLEQ